MSQTGPTTPGKPAIAMTMAMPMVASTGRGEVVVGTGAAQAVRHLFGARAPGAFPQLSERELDVLQLLATGADNATIARRLFLAEKTVRNRVSDILGKLGAATRAEAVALARDAGLGTEG